VVVDFIQKSANIFTKRTKPPIPAAALPGSTLADWIAFIPLATTEYYYGNLLKQGKNES